MLWTPPAEATPETISAALYNLGARQWQIEIAGPIVEEAINRPAAPAPTLTASPTAEPAEG
jgi:ribonuclease D